MRRGPIEDGKGNRRRGKGSVKKFIRVEVGMMKSPAWRSLSGNAVKVYIDMAQYQWAHNGELSYSGGQAGDVLQRNRSTGQRALQELEAEGFIVREAPAFISPTGRKASTWRLTPFPVERNGKVQLHPTRDYINWRPETVVSKAAGRKQKRCALATQSVSPVHQMIKS